MNDSAARDGDASERLWLVDGTYTVFRSFFAIRGLNAPDGRPTNAVFGLVNTVRKYVREHRPHYLGVAFDLEGPTHRDEAYAEYKAQREEPPPELVPQFELAQRACEVLGWPVLAVEGYEADDVIGTLARQARERGLEVVIVTSDKDLYQLVEPGVVVLNPAKDDRILDEEGVREVFGVPPARVVDVLALMGDKVDNVPGVAGVGEKTAKAIIARYGSLDEVLARACDFAELWRARETALAALAEGDLEAAAAALAPARAAAVRLAEREEAVAEADGPELAARFRAVAEIDPIAAGVRATRAALRDLQRKTSPKTWLAIAEHADEARFSRQLVTIARDAPIALDLDALRVGAPTPEAAAFFADLGFRRLTEEVERECLAAGAETAPRAADALAVRIARTRDELDSAVGALRAAGRVAFDTETTGLDPRRARLVGVSFAAAGDEGVYVPVGHAAADEPGFAPDVLATSLAPLLEDPGVERIAQHAAFDLAVLARVGIEVAPLWMDTLIAAQLLEPGRSVSHRLDDLARRYLDVRMISYQEVAGSGEGEKTLDDVDVETVARYAVEDAVVTWRLAPVLREELANNDLLELFETIEMPLVGVLERMERRGIRLDCGRLERMSVEFAEQLARLERRIYELAGGEFNVNSPQQLRVVLFERLGLAPTGRRTQKTRAHSTGQEALEALAAEHELPRRILEYRELAKLKSTYVDALPKLVDPADGRLHTRFHQLGAATGRLSSSDPNLQNIPVRTPLGRRIREAFVPEPGWKFLSADYSQMELRVLAHLSDDEELVGAFQRGVDIHRYTASLVAGVPLDEVDETLRSRAKSVNFGIIYGMSEFRLAREQGLSRDEARAFIEAYFERYPGVKRYIDEVAEQVQTTGEVRTLYGRLRRFPELADPDTQRRAGRQAVQQLLRQAVNATIQGTAADLVKKAMVAVEEAIAAEGLSARMLLQVHDELLFEAPVEELEALERLVRREMSSVAQLRVPLEVSIGVGDHWADAH